MYHAVMPDQGWSMQKVSLSGLSYPYYFGYDCIDRIVYDLRKYDADKFLVVTDDTVCELYGEEFLGALGRYMEIQVLSMPAGETMKSLDSVSRHLEQAIARGATRRSVVVAFGGGVPGNLAGLMAGLLFRGVRLIHVPTTAVAAMDSVISIKQAVNSSCGKNHIGVYHAPEAVYADVRMLQTLSDAELRSGFCEMLKNCLAIRPELIQDLRQLLASGDMASPEALLWLLRESLLAKLTVAGDDIKEQGPGLILEYGHTVGHAVELGVLRMAGTSRLSHGEAVAFGMVAAARVSAALGYLDASIVELHEDLVAALGAPICMPQGLLSADLMELVAADSKRGYLDLAQGEAAMVLLRDAGVPAGSDKFPLVPVPMNVLGDVLTGLSVRVGSEET